MRIEIEARVYDDDDGCIELRLRTVEERGAGSSKHYVKDMADSMITEILEDAGWGERP